MNPLVRCSDKHWLEVRGRLSTPQWGLLYLTWRDRIRSVSPRDKASAKALHKRGLVELDGPILKITDKGEQLANPVFAWDE